MLKNKVILLLGTNLGNKNNNLKLAQSLINREVGEVIKLSNILENEAVGFTSANTFLNQMLEIETSFSPIQVLKAIKSIENDMGRVYTTPLSDEMYVDRIIDIDILRFNNVNFSSKILKIPHHQIYTREFVSLLTFNL